MKIELHNDGTVLVDGVKYERKVEPRAKPEPPRCSEALLNDITSMVPLAGEERRRIAAEIRHLRAQVEEMTRVEPADLHVATLVAWAERPINESAPVYYAIQYACRELLRRRGAANA